MEADPELLLRVIAGLDNDPTWCVPLALDMPAGARVQGVHYDPSTKLFHFIVHCADFDPVPLGDKIPEIRMRYRNVELRKDVQNRLDGYRRELESVAGELTKLAATWAPKAGMVGEEISFHLREIAGNIETGLECERVGDGQ